MTIRLRDYQAEFVRGIRDAWQTAPSVLGVCATGGGKTVSFAAIMQRHVGACAAVVHRKEIIGQISQTLARLGVKHRVIAPPAVVTRIRRKHLKEFDRSYVDPHALAGVASVQTITSAASGRNDELQRWLGQVTLAVFDEGHHYVESGLWARAVEALDRGVQLFVTATPDRADGKGLGREADGFADVMVEGPSTQELIEGGYLSPFTYRAPMTDLDVSGVAITASGELNAKALRARVVESHLVGDVVRHYRRFADGKKAIVFATDVATAHEIADAFTADGVAAVALSGETDGRERDRDLDAFQTGGLDVLVNVDLFDEGFDVPGVEAVLLARPTESLAKYLQMVGRALRVIYAGGFDLSTVDGRRAAIAAGPKPEAIIIDPVRNWERHGMPNWPRRWSLDGKDKGTRDSAADTIPQRVCDACTQPYERFFAACPYCGHVPAIPERRAPDQVDGDLMELDVEGMAALFAAIDRAGMDDDAYGSDQLRRGIPAIGRGADMKRHRAAKHRREVLRELVAWWAGMQPDGRTLSEKHRRFYHRFGIDIGTAFTLPARDTDALIQRITERFSEDMTA